MAKRAEGVRNRRNVGQVGLGGLCEGSWCVKPESGSTLPRGRCLALDGCLGEMPSFRWCSD